MCDNHHGGKQPPKIPPPRRIGESDDQEIPIWFWLNMASLAIFILVGAFLIHRKPAPKWEEPDWDKLDAAPYSKSPVTDEFSNIKVDFSASNDWVKVCRDYLAKMPGTQKYFMTVEFADKTVHADCAKFYELFHKVAR